MSQFWRKIFAGLIDIAKKDCIFRQARTSEPHLLIFPERHSAIGTLTHHPVSKNWIYE